LNWQRLLVMRDPDVAPHADAFDALLARTPDEAEIAYDLPQPKWWFLFHLVRVRGFVLHGSNERAIEEFEPRANFDAHGVRKVEGIWASDDAIWPMYFATVNRPVAQSYINWCSHVRGASRYLFSIGSDPRDDASWTTGTIYVLRSDTFTHTPESRELTSEVPVRPRARLTVEPDDFPFKHETRTHRRGESVRSVVWRNALRMPGSR
jgi:hypothetical protein